MADIPLTPLTGDALQERFQALDAFLLAHQALWRPRPFVDLHLPWEAHYPELATWLRGRTLQQAEADHNAPHALIAPAPFTELATTAQALSAIGGLPSITTPEPMERQAVDVPGRKWQQIEAFASRLIFCNATVHWLDWCAGKGHLGRRLIQPGQQLTCLEYDPALVQAGQQQSQRLTIAAHHRLQDVLDDSAAEHLHAEQTPVALHACGDLHVRLLQLASAKGCRQLAVAPCCYNRIHTPAYQALSHQAQQSALELSLDDLRLPLSETVTAGQRQRQQRDLSMARRLGFDLLQRHARNTDEYLPTPSLPVSWLHKSFAGYCHHLAELKGFSLPANQDWDAVQAHGWQRLAEVRNLELLRNLFRRPLEVWLLLDRALYLQEHGYSVSLGTFCDYQITPRNLLLLAERH